ncbi:MAG: AraC family transcriptional regulator [Oscillospiraceae bacterium]|nr:AraC family transcriptional regulator [Oscillospiraceae bacterium]
MEWIERLNRAMDYIETHLTDDVDYQEAARLACCSTFHFQRMFSYMAGIPLSEYIRRRKMTLAALELQGGEEKVLDLALKYGYQSPTAFNRAFQSIHGIAPSEAKKAGACLGAYPPLSFKLILKGVEKMEYRIEKKESFRILGFRIPMEKEIEKNFATVPKFWDKLTRDGSFEKILSKMDPARPGVLGACCCGSSEEQWYYYIAVASDGPVEDGMAEYQIPASMWAVFPGEGPMPQAIQDLEKRIATEWFPTSGYEYGNSPDFELYLDNNPANAKFEVWMPIVKK